MFLPRKDESLCVTLGLLLPVIADNPSNLRRVKVTGNYFVRGADARKGFSRVAWPPQRLTLGKHV